jgi:hypothetical protein
VPPDLVTVQTDRLTRECTNAETELKLATSTATDLGNQSERVLAAAGRRQTEHAGRR